MGLISVTLQNRMNPQQFYTESDGDRFLCPICDDKGIKAWVKKNIIETRATFITGTCHCDFCGSNYSLNR